MSPADDKKGRAVAEAGAGADLAKAGKAPATKAAAATAAATAVGTAAATAVAVKAGAEPPVAPVVEARALPLEKLALRPGAEVEHANRRGVVREVRGNGDRPYDVQIRWTSEKYPEWHLFAALECAHAQGKFRVLRAGRGRAFGRR